MQSFMQSINGSEVYFQSFLIIFLVILLSLILLFNKDRFQRVLFISIIISILIIDFIVFMNKCTSIQLFAVMNKPEVTASLMVAIPTVSTWIMESRTKTELEKINNLKTAQEIRENINDEKSELISEIEDIIGPEKLNKLDSLSILRMLNSLDNFLMKISEVSSIYRQLNTITFKLDIERLYGVTYQLFEEGLKKRIFPEKGDITSRFGEIFTKLIKNKLLYGIESKESKDIYRDIAFLLLDDQFEKLYYIDFADIFEKEKLIIEQLSSDGRGKEVFFNHKEFFKCTISNSLVSMLKDDNTFKECNVSKLDDDNREKFEQLCRNGEEGMSDDEI